MIYTIFKYILIGLIILIVYELIRAFLKGIFVKSQNKAVRKFIDNYGIKLDKYKFMNKVIVKQELMNDNDINQEIIKYAKENDLNISDVQNEVETYIEEIVPFFNLLSYYKIGFFIANLILNLIYEVVIDKKNTEKLKKIKKDNVVVFVMNHRSNIDYIIVAYMLARNISLSYAVGEWARVWPLEYIFKSFGAYFIRRRFRKKIYHVVLQKYIQLISIKGVTQGIFLEGGLSRDGKLRDPKLGILDYIVQIKKDKNFKKDIVFIPVGINYDWVLEDKNLIHEWKVKKEKTGFKENFSSLIKLIVKGPLIMIINLFRLISGKLKHHGYASVSFGDPVSVTKYLNNQKVDIFKLDRKKRLSEISKFANFLMKEIGTIIPTTPVCLTARAILLLKKDEFTKLDLIKKISEQRNKLIRNKRRIVLGKAFINIQKSLEELTDEKKDRQKDLVNFEEEFLIAGEARKTAKVGLEILSRRNIIKIRNDNIFLSKEMKPFLDYYSNSLNNLF